MCVWRCLASFGALSPLEFLLRVCVAVLRASCGALSPWLVNRSPFGAVSPCVERRLYVCVWSVVSVCKRLLSGNLTGW